MEKPGPCDWGMLRTMRGEGWFSFRFFGFGSLLTRMSVRLLHPWRVVLLPRRAADFYRVALDWSVQTYQRIIQDYETELRSAVGKIAETLKSSRREKVLETLGGK